MIFSKSQILSKLPENKVLISLAEFASRENINLYLVGGTVRDIILDRPLCDIDFSISVDAVDFASRFAKMIGVKSIILDEILKTARLIFRNGNLYIDFSSIRGENIIIDLLARDITINSMAVDFLELMNSESAELIDPYNCIDDLNNRTIKITSQQAVIDDPLRMLRAFRFFAILNFNIHDSSISLIKSFPELLKLSSSERVRDELYKILDTKDSAKTLRAMDNVNLLEQIFPEINPMRGMEQNEYHHLDVWDHSMLALDFLERETIPPSLNKYSQEIEKYLNFEIVKNRTRMSLLKLSTLLHDVGKPSARTIDKKGRIRFFDHHRKGAEISLNIGTRLKLATREIKSINRIIEYHMLPLLLSLQKRDISHNASSQHIMYFIYATGMECLAILLLSYADLQATQGLRRSEDDLKNLDRLLGEITDRYFQEVNSSFTQLISGDELIKNFGFSEGTEIGHILSLIKESRINGSIKDRQDAINFVKEITRISKPKGLP